MSGGTYAVANAAQRALLFLLLPVYTAVLSPAEYGRLGLLLTIQAGAIVIMQAGMDAAVLRHFFLLEGDNAAQRRYVMTCWNFLLVVVPGVALIAVAGLLVLAPSAPVFRPAEAALAIASAAVFVAATVVPLSVLRAEQRLRDYVILTGVTGLSSAVLTLVLVAGLSLGVTGWFIAILVSNIATLAVAMRILPWARISNGIDRPRLRTSLHMGLTLLPHGMSLWALQLADRILLAGLVSASALGAYTLGANLAFPAMIVIQSMNQGFMPAYARLRQRDAAAEAELREVITAQVLLVLVVGCGVTLASDPIVQTLSDDYADAAVVVPWLVLAYVFWGLYQVPMNMISLISGRTNAVWVLGMGATVVTLLGIVVFVPRFGIQAAAIASACGYLVLFALSLGYVAQLRMRVPVDWARVTVGAALASAAFVFEAAAPSTGLPAYVCRVLAMIVVVGGLARIAGVGAAQLGSLRERIRAMAATRAR